MIHISRPALLLLTVGLILRASAQETPKFRFGLKVAPNSAALRAESDEMESSGSSTNWSFGMLGDFRLRQSDTWSISSGIVLSNIGGSLRLDGTVDRGTGPTTVKGDLDLRMRYLEIPLMLKLHTHTTGALDLYAVAGASGAFHLRSRADGTRTLTTPGSPGTTTTYDNEGINQDVAFFKAAVVVGAGLEFTLPSGQTLVWGLTYSAAFTNALDENAGLFVTDSDKTKLYPDYWEISLGIFL